MSSRAGLPRIVECEMLLPNQDTEPSGGYFQGKKKTWAETFLIWLINSYVMITQCPLNVPLVCNDKGMHLCWSLAVNGHWHRKYRLLCCLRHITFLTIITFENKNIFSVMGLTILSCYAVWRQLGRGACNDWWQKVYLIKQILRRLRHSTCDN